ncbi:MAG TPA: MMPL family transporter [Microthrixaceae bacterium]|nr:MMPL family transporter [Microthrixaceae bacterium]
MQRFWSWLAVYLGRHAGMVGAIGLVFTIVIGFGITRLEFATGQDSYLNRDSAVYQDNVRYQDLFGGQAMLSLVTMEDGRTVDELFTPENIETMERVAQRLEESGHALAVVSPLTALEFSHRLVQSETGNPADSIAGRAILRASEVETDPEAKAARLADGAVTLQRTAEVPPEEQRLDNPEWVRFLLYDNQGEIRPALRSVFLDETHTQMLVRLHGNLSIEDEGAASDAIKEITEDFRFEGASVTTTGAPVLLKGINDYLRGGMLTLGGIAVAAMIVILMLFFDVRWRLLPLAVVLIGIVWAFGLVGYLGIPLTLVTIAGLPIMLGIGIDYAIQMHSRIEEEVIVDREPHPIQAAARGLGPALLVVTFDAVFAFLAIQLSQVPMIREFGWLLTVGIVAICISSIINPLAALGIREFRSPTKGRDFREGPLGRLVLWLGSVPASAALPLAIVSVVVFALGSYVEPRLTLETDPVNWVDQDSEVIRDIRTIEREIGGASDLGIYVEAQGEGDGGGATTVYTDETVEYVSDLTMETMERFDEDLVVDSSIIGTVRKLTDVPGVPSIVPSAELVREAWEVAPEGIQKSTASAEGDAFNIIFLTAAGSLEDRAVVVDALRAETGAPEGVLVTPSGLAVVGVGLLENLEANLVELTWLAVALVFIFLAVRLRSLVRALLSLVPVLIASGAANVAIYLVGIELSPMTAVGGPLVVATCTEFTSLILLRYIEERRRGLEPRPAIDATAARTGRAFIVSAMTAVAGVAVISFSSLPLLSNFGMFMALKITIALIAALTVLPPLIIWADRRGWVSRGMLDHVEQPYIETPDRPLAASGER